MSGKDLEKRLLASLPKRKVTPYNLWKEAVLASYPQVFFPTLNAKKNSILKNVYSLIESNGVEPTKFFEWIVANWSQIGFLLGSSKYKSFTYPELDLILYDYAKLLNIYKSRVVVAKPATQVKNTIKWDLDDIDF